MSKASFFVAYYHMQYKTTQRNVKIHAKFNENIEIEKSQVISLRETLY